MNEKMSDLYKQEDEKREKIESDKKTELLNRLKEKHQTLEQYIKKKVLIKNIFLILTIVSFVDTMSRPLMNEQDAGIVVLIIGTIIPINLLIGLLANILSLWIIWLVVFSILYKKVQKIKSYQNQ